MPAPARYLISYDIRHPARLRRVHRLLRSRASALLESLFLFHGSPAELATLYRALQREIDPGCDDLRIDRLHPGRPIGCWGRACPGPGLYDFTREGCLDLPDHRLWIPDD